MMINPGPPPASRHRRQRIPADEVRAKMLTAARDLVFASGVTVSLEELRLEDVIRHAGVPRSSVYRIWPYKGDFVDDLLCHLAGPDWFGAAAFDQDTIDLALKVVADHEQMLGTPGGRRAVVLEAARQAVLRNFRAIVTSREWQIYIALVATARSARDDEARARIGEALGGSQAAFITRMAEFYQLMADGLGLRLRSPAYSYTHVAAAAGALVEGLALRQILAEAQRGNPGSRTRQHRHLDLEQLISSPLPGPGIDGKPAVWSLAAIAFTGILDTFVEPDPNYSPAS
jgi:AcrR family transcriptional regulator